MSDFFMISTKASKKGTVEIYPKFIVGKPKDLMIRGGDFYAVWDEDTKLWNTEETDCLRMIDNALDKFAEENKSRFVDTNVRVLHLWDAESGMIDTWHKYCQRQMRDNFKMLDEKIIFSNVDTKKTDYASKKLPYPLEDKETPAWDELVGTLYSEEERHKIEWAIGSIVSGDSKKIQKFLVLYGSAGTGKSTILNIIQKLFEGYYSVFDAKALGSASNAFALEAFKTNPLVAIQHDGDLSRIEDNTRLNSLVSHEMMTVNEKFKSTYTNRFKCFLFMGTNKPVKITDAKSGLIRRLIDVKPTGKKVDGRRYNSLMKMVDFELGGIAQHCLNVYLDEPDAYDTYTPTSMMDESNDFYNYILDSFEVFGNQEYISLKQAWELYKNYCEEARVPYPLSQRLFKSELKNYFKNFEERVTLEDGTRLRSAYSGFDVDKFSYRKASPNSQQKHESVSTLGLKKQHSLLDDILADCPAQYATADDKPSAKWSNVETTLKDLDTDKVHYVKVPEDHIVIDFDIPDENGKKSRERNLVEASKWPPTYTELSKSGNGVHLHYIYTGGDSSLLKRVYDDHIEIKVFTGNASLRRKLVECNDIPVATISSGLPTKGEKKVVNFDNVKSEKGLRSMIKKNLNKEIHPGTKPSIDFIYKLLEEAYDSGTSYDVSDMRSIITSFAANSTNQAETCLKIVSKMKFKSSDIPDPGELTSYEDTAKIVFYDVEVFPNLFLINWKYAGEENKVVRMINPTPAEIEELVKFKLVGFNCRRYDNHILYARLLGYSNEQLYSLSQKIVTGQPGCMFNEAYNLSYTDVYDFSSKKQSLKKFEIELGIHHQELGLPWDQPVEESLWPKVAEYCDNDVIATEAVFNARKADFTAREILAAVAGMTVNDTTNSLTTRIIFGKERRPQGSFNYRNMGDETGKMQPLNGDFDTEWTWFTKNDRPIFPGYIFDSGKSTYRGEEVGEGGYVYAEPGIYTNVALLDIASMHPSSIVAEDLFGPYTERFNDILQARIAIKHKEFDRARKMLDGKLAPFLDDEGKAKDLAQALKIAINSVYGLTSAGFENPFRDPRNKDNIVAKRGALFMINLKHEVQKKGFTVAHIKTDSIKIPEATPEIINFVMEYGRMYGYNFEHEATYDRMCLVNDAVYIAKYASDEEHPDGAWTATGTQFQVPYVFKTLFSKEPIIFDDMCETKSVQTSLYLDMNENLPDVTEFEKIDADLKHKFKLGYLNEEEYEKEKAANDANIATGHDYVFIGKVGNFCPVKAGCGGGLLMRDQKGKFYSVSGTKGYRWLESEQVRTLGKQDDIDVEYYHGLCDDAVDTIKQYGDFEWFAGG